MQVPERRFRAGRVDTNGDHRVRTRGHARCLAQHMPERVDERDGEVGVHAAEETVRPGTMADFAGCPHHRCGSTQRARLHQHVFLGNHRDRGPYLAGDVPTGHHKDSLARNQRFQAGDGLGDERPLADQREDLLRPIG